MRKMDQMRFGELGKIQGRGVGVLGLKQSDPHMYFQQYANYLYPRQGTNRPFKPLS